jgi:hypothetical protein
MPPIPFLEASPTPLVLVCASRMISLILVGRDATSTANHLKSERKYWVFLVRRTRFQQGVLLWISSCSAEKSPMASGITMAINRSPPTNFCHFSRDTWRCIGLMESNTSWSRRMRWAGKVIVRANVLTTQPKMVLVVARFASPFSIFFKEACSCQ